MLEGAPRGSLEIVVACNGCDDRTAEIARGYGDPVTVVETATASKTAALNLGDQAASAFPRLYVDADVVMQWPSIEKIAASLQSGQPLAAAPRAETELGEASVPVRAFYRVWTRTDYFRAGMIGCGVYALNEAGRGRFGRFPEIIADDGFVRSLVRDHERVRVPGATVRVVAPKTLSGLVRAKTRSRLGRYELARKYPEQLRQEQAEKRYGGALLRLLKQPSNWLSVPHYLAVNVAVRLRARRQLYSLTAYHWERDESSRQLE